MDLNCNRKSLDFENMNAQGLVSIKVSLNNLFSTFLDKMVGILKYFELVFMKKKLSVEGSN